jgi:D-alanyl-lipoteichoic acid acyltransferase DltB (MBOAT superfamily)
MKILLSILLPVAYIWAACYVGGEVLPDGWTERSLWWECPAYITFAILGILSLVPLMVVTTPRYDYDEYP